MQHTAADFHAKNSLVNVYMSSCRPFTCKFECIFKMTDFGCENTCKLLIFITTANMANEKLENDTADSRPTVGRLSVDRRPTVDRQSTDRFFGEVFFTITEHLYS